MNTEILIKECQKGRRQAQRQLYDVFSAKLYQVGWRYLKQDADIQDALSEAWYVIFTKLNKLKDIAAFEAWAKKITVNECLQLLRKKVNFHLSINDLKVEPEWAAQADHHLNHKELLALLSQLPEGCKTVFNLYIIEGYNHREIAELLDISEGTSKSQLSVAKGKLQNMINSLYHQNEKENGTAK